MVWSVLWKDFFQCGLPLFHQIGVSTLKTEVVTFTSSVLPTSLAPKWKLMTENYVDYKDL